jgi:hypothetical protein
MKHSVIVAAGAIAFCQVLALGNGFVGLERHGLVVTMATTTMAVTEPFRKLAALLHRVAIAEKGDEVTFFTVTVITVAKGLHHVAEVSEGKLKQRHFFATHIAERVYLVKKVTVIKDLLRHSLRRYL